MAIRRTPEAPVVPPEVLTLLAGGWHAVELTEASAFDYLSLFDFSDQACIDLYVKHREMVDEEARRLGRDRPAIADCIGLWRAVGRTDLRWPTALSDVGIPPLAEANDE